MWDGGTFLTQQKNVPPAQAPAFIQETQELHGAESFILHQDLRQVCPYFFEQGPDAFGILPFAQKNIMILHCE